MPNSAFIVHVSKSLNFYRYAPNRYYVYTHNNVPLGDICRGSDLVIYEPSSQAILTDELMDEISEFLRILKKGEL